MPHDTHRDDLAARASALVGFPIQVGDVVVTTCDTAGVDHRDNEHEIAKGALAIVGDINLYAAPQNVGITLTIPVDSASNFTDDNAVHIVGLWDEDDAEKRFAFRQPTEAERSTLHPSWLHRPANAADPATLVTLENLNAHIKNVGDALAPALRELETHVAILSTDVTGENFAAILRATKILLGLGTNATARILKVPGPTVERWTSGKAKPAPILMRAICQTLSEKIHNRLVLIERRR